MIHGAVISSIGCVESDLDSSLPEVVRLRSFAHCSGRVGDDSLTESTHGSEEAESRVRNIDVTFTWSEWLEVFTPNRDLIATSLRSSVWVDNGDLRIVVIPVLNWILGLLLSVE